jgi:hypothetical protein
LFGGLDERPVSIGLRRALRLTQGQPKNRRLSQAKSDPHAHANEERKPPRVVNAQVGPNGSAEIARQEDCTQKACSRNKKQDGYANLDDAESGRKFERDTQFIEHLLLSGKVDELGYAAGTNQKETNQSGQNPTNRAFCFGCHKLHLAVVFLQE